jgi:hypothetical protein
MMNLGDRLMKLLVVVSLAALSLAGRTAAQGFEERGGHLAGIMPESSSAYRAEARAVMREMRLACDADAKTLCAHKQHKALNRCIIYHSQTISAPCKQALVKATLASTGRL